MVIHVHTRILANVNLANGLFGLTGQIVPSHVAVVPVSNPELESELRNVPRKVFRLKVAMEQEMNAVVHVMRGRHGVHALKHVPVELNQEVVPVVLVLDVPMRLKVDHVTVMLCAVMYVPNGLIGAVAVSLVILERKQDREHVVQNQDALL